MADIETVKIESDDFEGGVIINKSDFDKKTQKLYVEPDAKPGRWLGEGIGSDDEDAAYTVPGLMKKTKDELIVLAKESGLSYPTPDDVTKETIANAIIAKQ